MTINRALISILIIIAIILLVYFLVLPKYQEFKNLQATVGSKQAEFNAKYAYFAEVNRIFDELDKRKGNLDKIDKALPDNVSLAPLVYFLQKKGTESGLVMKNVFFTKASVINQTNPVREIVFSMNIMGTYPALKSFLASLEKSANLFEVSSISFSNPIPSKTVTQPVQSYSFTLEISTHSY